jgi:hypothetical protein
MEREKTINISPVCRFGPGGDYTSNWPSEWADLVGQPKGPLAGLLNILTGFIEALRGRTEYKGQMTEDRASEQAFLFPDALMVNKPARNKITHRIRTYKPLARKRHCFSPSRQPTSSLRYEGQATLFDAELKDARTA